MNTTHQLKKFNWFYTLLLLVAFLPSKSSYAQGSCVDSSLINPFAICPLVYAPVCGCDNVTYDNSCIATNLGGVTSWTPGPCSGSGGCIDLSLINPSIMCPSIYNPVCGCDGNTYSNSCEAQNWYGVTSWTQGPCAGGGGGCIDSTLIGAFPICPTVIDPVCGCNGVTYDNSCLAQNSGVTTWTPGACGGGSGCIDSSLINPNIACPLIYAPVCGCDGVTYGNSCEATNYGGVTSWTQGPCGSGGGCIDSTFIDPSIMCPAIYDPVCGCDSVTYSNSCEAENWYGVTSWTPGPCGGASNCIDSTLIDITVLCPGIIDEVCGCDGNTYINSCVAQSYFGVTSWTMGACGPDTLIYADPCDDLTGVDFGPCDLFMGYGIVNGVCTPLNGCGPIVNGIDYSAAIFASSAACDSACNGNVIISDPCLDLDSIDFGVCATPLGIGIINGQCAMISGCSPIVMNVDYSPSLYISMDSCQACLTNQINPITNYDLSLYPNPTSGKVTLKLSTLVKGKVVILDLTGRILIRESLDGLSHEMDLATLSSGTYYVQVQTENATLTKKIVKK